MKDEEYAYAVSAIKILDSKMSQKSDFDRLEDVEAMRQAAYNEAINLLGKSSEADIFFYRNDFCNLKAVLKAIFYGIDWHNLMLSPCNIPPSLIDDALKRNNFDMLPEFIRTAAEKAYELMSGGSAELAEIYIDNEWKRAVIAESDGYLHDYFKLLVRLINYKTLLRCLLLGASSDFCENASGFSADSLENAEKMILKEFPDAKLDSVRDFELWCDDKLEEYASVAFKEYFSSRPILAFLIKTELRAKKLGRLICAK